MPLLAGLHAFFLQSRMEFTVQRGDVNDCLHRALFTTIAEERSIRAFAQHQAKGTDDDGLAGPGLTGHGVVARPKLNRQVIDKGEVFDAEIGQHVPVARECEKRLLLRQNKRV